MAWFTRWAFGNKAAVSFMVVLILGMGIFSYFTLPMEFLPEADQPQVTVTVLGQGMDAKTMESVATIPIEKAISSVNGKTNVFSSSGDGFAKLDIGFDSDTKMKDAKAEVQEAVNTVVLPAGMSKPFVIQFNTSMIPIAQLSLTFKDGFTKENMELAENKIVPEFEKIKGVSSVALMGLSQSSIVIHPDQAKLDKANVPLQALMGVLQGQNSSTAIGEKSIDGKSTGITVIGNLDNLDALNNLTVAPNVKLKDVATVEATLTQESVTRVNGSPSLVLIVTKDGSSNAVTIGKEIADTSANVSTKFPNATSEVFYATSDMVVTSVNSMIKEVLLGALFATIVILLFLRNIRSTIITIVSIPLSLGLTLFLLSKSGVTLNILTLGGVAVAVGRLVDDSIVVIENIFRRTQKAGFSVDLIIEATREVARAITSSTLTTIAVFLPIGLLSGSLQSFLLPFALTVTYSLMASLFVALTVVPIMSAWLLKNVELKPHKEPKSLSRILQWTLNHKFISIALSIVVFAGSIGLYVLLPKGTVSASDSSFISVSLTYPPEVSVDQVKEKAIELENFITAQSEAKYTILQQGNSADGAQWGQVTSANRADFSIIMKEDVDAEHFIKQVSDQKKNYPGGNLVVETGSFDGSSSSSITLDVTGDNVKDLTTAITQVNDSIKGIDGIVKISSNQDELKPGYQIVVDPAKANPQQTAMQISAVLNGAPIGSMKLDGKETPVILDALVNPTKQSDLSGIQIMTAEGPKQLSNIASIVKTESTSSILHKEGQQYLRITVQVEAKKLSVVDGEIKTKTEGLKLPKGVTLLQGGASAQQNSDFMDLFMTMVISIGLVFLIMVITFKSFRAPIAIILSLPFAAIGAIVAMMLTGTSFDVTSMFGALMLIGIVVTNAIVLIDRVKQNEQVMTIRDSLLEAAATRMRPILMTAIATICAMLPLLFSKAEEGSIVSQGLAIVVIGGLAAATALTLVMVPVIYESLHFIKAKRERKKQKATTTNQLSA